MKKTVNFGEISTLQRWHKSLPLGVCRSPTPKLHPPPQRIEGLRPLAYAIHPGLTAAAMRRLGLAARARPTCRTSVGRAPCYSPGGRARLPPLGGCLSSSYNVTRQTAPASPERQAPSMCVIVTPLPPGRPWCSSSKGAPCVTLSLVRAGRSGAAYLPYLGRSGSVLQPQKKRLTATFFAAPRALDVRNRHAAASGAPLVQ